MGQGGTCTEKEVKGEKGMREVCEQKVQLEDKWNTSGNTRLKRRLL